MTCMRVSPYGPRQVGEDAAAIATATLPGDAAALAAGPADARAVPGDAGAPLAAPKVDDAAVGLADAAGDDPRPDGPGPEIPSTAPPPVPGSRGRSCAT